jgi:hypothetical protein
LALGLLMLGRRSCAEDKDYKRVAHSVLYQFD